MQRQPRLPVAPRRRMRIFGEDLGGFVLFEGEGERKGRRKGNGRC